MPTHNSLRCTIHTKDGPLKEYRLDDSQASTDGPQTVYIEAKHGLNFWILFEALPDYKFITGDTIVIRRYIDGEPIGNSPVVDGCNLISKDYGARSIDGPIQFSQSFKFSEILLVENHDPGANTNKVSFEYLGEITIHGIRSTRGQILEHLSSVQGSNPEKHPEKINEKSFKGRDSTHVVKLGPKEVDPRPWMFCRYKHIDKTPYVHFRFLYRSKRVLQGLGLIPRTPSPSPPVIINPPAVVGEVPALKVDSGSKTTIEQEIAKLRDDFQAQIEALQKIYKVKREIKEEEGYNPQPKRVKVEEGRGKTNVGAIGLKNN